MIGEVSESLREVVREDCERAFGGRLKDIEGALELCIPNPCIILFA